MDDKKKKPQIDDDDVFDQYYDLSSVASATSYTNLTPTPPLDESQAEAYSELWSYPKLDSSPQLHIEKNED